MEVTIEKSSAVTLDQHGPVTKHQQLREILLDFIHGLEPEAPIPSEREIAVKYGVARMTVRQAVESLVADGRLFKVAGKGTFVARPKLDLQARLTSFREEMSRRGMVPSSSVLAFTRVTANAHLAAELSVPAGESLVHLHRLRNADGTPMTVELTWIPERLVPGLADGTPPTSLRRPHRAVRAGAGLGRGRHRGRRGRPGARRAAEDLGRRPGAAHRAPLLRRLDAAGLLRLHVPG